MVVMRMRGMIPSAPPSALPKITTDASGSAMTYSII